MKNVKRSIIDRKILQADIDAADSILQWSYQHLINALINIHYIIIILIVHMHMAVIMGEEILYGIGLKGLLVKLNNKGILIKVYDVEY